MLYRPNSWQLPNTALNIYSSCICFHPLNHNYFIKEAFMCHSVPLLQHARFNPWQCYTPYFQCQSTSKKRNTMLWLTKHSTYSVYYTGTRRSWRPPNQIMKLSNRSHAYVPCSNSQIKLPHANRIINSCKHGNVLCHLLIRHKPWIRIHISTPMLISGNEAPYPEIHGWVPVGTLAPNRYCRVLCALHSITQTIYIPVIVQKKDFC